MRSAGLPGASEAGFFERVYAVVRRIPPGRVATYGQVAALLGNPRAARGVGWALAALPAASGVPWHRVIGATGRISSRGREVEAALQGRLLAREGVRVGRDGRVALEARRWRPSSRIAAPARRRGGGAGPSRRSAPSVSSRA